jgi:UDP-2,4-diacetamido-2,4,6-trideoxy-beta-L-altropyranose hydrolase
MKDLLTEADVAVTGGGQILNELARVGVPTVAIGLADNQYSNLEGWQARGFIELAGWWDTPSLSAGVESCLSAFVHLEERRHRTEIGRALVDGQGSRRIRSEIAQWS